MTLEMYAFGVASTITGLVAREIIARIRKCKGSKKVDEPHSIRWCWITGRYSSDPNGIRCPKCVHIRTNNKQPRFCECLEFPRAHFHFTCNDCGYTAIMRTADDR